MEAAFGHDFSSVRIHDDARAAIAVRDMGARAYALGDRIVLPPGGDGRPGWADRRLLAHELAHVVQQRRGGPPPDVQRSAIEADANRVAEAVTRGEQRVGVDRGSGVGPAMQPVEEEVASLPQTVPIEPISMSPPRARILASVSDAQISQELYGRPDVPIEYVASDEIAVHYSTLLQKWRPAFREAATAFERTGAEETIPTRRAGDATWRATPRWAPVRDPARGGLVVGYRRSSGGYTEVRNTAGEVVFTDEIGVQALRIPLVDDALDLLGAALVQGGYALAGAADAFLEDNWEALGLPPVDEPFGTLFDIPSDALAYRIGRGAGHALALLQASAEIVGGLSLVITGGAEFLVGIATTAGGVGLIVMPVAVVQVAAGTTVAIHGGVLAGAVFKRAAREGGGGGGGGPKRRKPWKPTKEGTAETRVDAKERFGRFFKSKSDGLWWSKDTARTPGASGPATGHGGSVWKVFEETPRGLKWIADADEFGTFIAGKHKGPTGLFIPWAELIPVPW